MVSVSPKVLSSPKLSRPPLPVSSKSNLKDFVIGNEKAKSASKSATVGKPKSGTTVEKSASNKTNATSEQPKSTTTPADAPTKLKQAKSTTTPANPPKEPRVAKSDSILEQQVGAKQQKVEKPTKSSKSAPRGSVWTQVNPKFKFGEPFLSKIELEKVGPRCVALQAWYMKECEEQRTGGMVAVIKCQHF